ncbi:hypothetical protein F5Y19DRAFT_416311 [Xylariaceae sp. FL1651]|nr:hypothetical protein F5Y19DRAFT_416311 [Xylariaceae sp. FL1651]
MPFPYKYICDLLQELDDELRKSPEKQTPSETIIKCWFQQHRSLFNAPGNDACAILSTLLPERRTDRVYFIQAPKLQSIFGKALLLGASRVKELRRYLEPGSGVDLGECIEEILSRTPNSLDDKSEPTVEEIDETLSRIAATCRFSSPAVRALQSTPTTRHRESSLASIYKRLSSRGAKWFTRLVLKNYQPVTMNAHIVFRNYHPLLPQMMKIRDDLSIATAFVRHISEISNEPSAISSILKPRLGTKVGRQPWFKGRSIKNCLDMARGREVICEQKIDGEYCQIHIDLQKPPNYIQIFSKSGKDSTIDRKRLHKAIRDSLKIGKEDCPIKRGCILEGELVVYSTKENKILPFHKIRKHVSRSGAFLGTANDSQAHEYEHLMIIYYDALLIDDESLLGMNNTDRFQRLSKIITCRKGHAELVTRTTISTSRRTATEALRELFARCIVSRSEGLVLKPDEPYFDFTITNRQYSCCNIKLKKEYIQGWGDVGDFAVVGASYDSAKAREYRIPNVRWTHFFIGCLENKNQAQAKTEMPRFLITNIVELSGPVLSTFWAQRRPLTIPFEKNKSIILDDSRSMLAKRPTVVFPKPLVFDMRCFAFDKEPNTNFWSMRFPQVSKVHHDRSYLDTITFSELQEIAETARLVPLEEDSQEMRQWVKALEMIDHGRNSIDAVSQASTCTNNAFPPSPSPSPSPSPPNSIQFTPRQPRCNLLSSSRFSAVEAVVSIIETDHSSSTTSASSRGKRISNENSGSSSAAKRPRKHSDALSAHSPLQNSLGDSSSTHTRHREPLSQVDANIPEQDPTESQRHSSALLISYSQAQDNVHALVENITVPSSPIAYCAASEVVSSSPSRIAPPQRNPVTVRTQSQARDKGSSSACCSRAGAKCVLANSSILLSPCISSYAWITEDLLIQHGIADPLLDPRVWKYVNRRSSTGSSESGIRTKGTPERKNRTRKICLVESRRKEATEAFLQKIQDADLKKSDGGRDWVAVYDWRVLEFVTEQELVGKPLGGTDPWRRFYVGIA